MTQKRFALFLCLAALGCSPTSTPAPTATTTTANPPGATTQVTEVDLKLVTATEFAAEMAAREGKVVLLDMWATW